MVGSRRAVVSFAGWLALANGSCMFEHACTDLGCESGASAKLTPESGAWEPGHYDLQVTLDDKQATCTFVVPSGAPHALDCGKVVRGELFGGSDSHLQLFIKAEPKILKIDLSRDDMSILSDSQALSYVETQPNPGCVPICENATASFTTK